MSLDMYLFDDDGEVMGLNWLRNSFGLIYWAEDNTGLAKGRDELSIWDVCNQWSYDEGENIDRKLFQDVVLAYWEKVKNLKQSYFFFDLPAYRHFVEGKQRYMPNKRFLDGLHITGEKYADDGRLMIPVEHFSHSAFNMGSECSTERYKKWFGQLVEFAERLQDKELRFYCSN
jgi:hypothetical protein